MFVFFLSFYFIRMTHFFRALDRIHASMLFAYYLHTSPPSSVRVCVCVCVCVASCFTHTYIIIVVHSLSLSRESSTFLYLYYTYLYYDCSTLFAPIKSVLHFLSSSEASQPSRVTRRKKEVGYANYLILDYLHVYLKYMIYGIWCYAMRYFQLI